MQKSLENDQYPKSITDTNNLLSNHMVEMQLKQNMKISTTFNTLSKAEEESIDNIPLSFTQIEGKCYCCGQSDHKSPEFRKRNQIAREDWYINKINFPEKEEEGNKYKNNNTVDK